ncbi:MAG: hypothetical protein B6I31_04095 [Desulfobacteraceae bacterium 4572_19]|nr:MAG: hypothetical protein B6I31_04095 [Desulfobacteraceae bacterium 4572_19]
MKNNNVNSTNLPSIDVIIVNYNGIKYLPDCLESLFLSQYPSFRVIIVDNASSDNSVKWIKKNYHQVTVIKNKINEGFGKANAKGIEYGDSPYFALLNNDTKVDRNWLIKLVEVMENNFYCATACSKLLFMNNPEVINASGGGMNIIGYGYDHNLFSNNKRASHKIKDVFFATAAACLIRRCHYNSINGFDLSFFMYHEDVDLGWRMNLMGYTVKYVPDSVVYHAFGGTSMKSGSMQFRNRLGLRHALRSLLKNYEITTLKYILPLFCHININNFKAGIATGFFRALLWNLLWLPDTVIKRCRVQRSRKKSDKKLSSLIWQDVQLPVQFPDYSIQNRKSFKNKSVGEDEINIADNTTCHLGYGWYACEPYFKDPSVVYRWTREEAIFFFRYSGRDGLLRLKVLGLSKLLGIKRAFTIYLTQYDTLSSLPICLKYFFTIESDHWESFDILLSGKPGYVEVRISVAKTWSPHEIFNNKDYRQLGMGVTATIESICN